MSMQKKVQENPINIAESVAKQREYTQHLVETGFDFSLVVAEAFVKGIRDIGYKSTATAIDEIIDNAIQAGATNVNIIFGYSGNSKSKPDKIAIFDNGHGMEPDMIRAAVLWGGTHRQDDRTGFGRYGFGLPSSCVSQGRRFTVYSLVKGGSLHSVSIDVDKIGEMGNGQGGLKVPKAIQSDLPSWVTNLVDEQGMSGFENGTLVVIDKLDRLSYKTTNSLKKLFLEHFGVTYRNYLRRTTLIVDGTDVKPVDPLFITEGMRFFDLDDDRAIPQQPLSVEVKNQGDKSVVGVINVRFSQLPPTFQRNKKYKPGGKEPSLNKRFAIMKEHRGIIICRNGRQIDVVDAKCPWFTFQNYDRNWQVEIDFPPTLDEEFSITTSKQQIVVSQRMWEILEDQGIKAAIQKLKDLDEKAREELRTAVEDEEESKRLSEKAMEEAEAFELPAPTTPEREKRSEEAFEAEVKRRAKESKVPESQVREQLQLEVDSRPYKIITEDTPGAAFYRVEQLGGQMVLYLNAAHRFYKQIYAAPDSTYRLRAAIEVLLFVLGQTEVDSEGRRRIFYESERNLWSRKLATALALLDREDPVIDELAYQDEVELAVA